MKENNGTISRSVLTLKATSSWLTSIRTMRPFWTPSATTPSLSSSSGRRPRGRRSWATFFQQETQKSGGIMTSWRPLPSLDRVNHHHHPPQIPWPPRPLTTMPLRTPWNRWRRVWPRRQVESTYELLLRQLLLCVHVRR